MTRHAAMPKRFALVAFAALTGLGCVSAPALAESGAAPPPQQPYVAPEQTHDVSVEAFFTSLDATGRYRTFIQVFAADGARIAAAPPLASRPLSIDVRVRDETTGDLVLDASGFASLEQSALQTDPRLTGARIVGELVGQEGVSGDEVSLAADLRVVGTGELVRTHDRIIVHEDGFMLNAVGQVVYRPGTATGSVTVNGVNHVVGPSLQAPMVDLVSGGVVIVANG